ncbi:MAG: 2OG-Fe(II) oxygenase [Actinomycetes bacterium]
MVEPLFTRPLVDRPPSADYAPFELHHRVFTPRQCDRIIELGIGLPASDAELERVDADSDLATDGVLDTSVRDSVTAWLPPDESSAWIYRKLADIAQRANRRYGFDLVAFEEDLQFTTYGTPGAFYTWHQDGLDAPVSHRKLSMVVQLSDPATYRGAELQFFEVAEDYDDELLDDFTEQSSRRGTVVVFPSFEYHRVLPLRDGVRHSLVAWVSGTPFR